MALSRTAVELEQLSAITTVSKGDGKDCVMASGAAQGVCLQYPAKSPPGKTDFAPDLDGLPDKVLLHAI